MRYNTTYPFIKGIHKKILAKSKRRTCDVLGRWAQSISNHIYWAAASSGGNGQLVRDKFLSILNHVTNVHVGHSELFPSCEHEALADDREWIVKGTVMIEFISEHSFNHTSAVYVDVILSMLFHL